MKTLENSKMEVPRRIKEGDPVAEAIRQFKENGIGALLVEREGEVTGILTRDHIIQKVMGRRNPQTVTAAEIMSSPLETLDIGTSLAEACLFACEHTAKYLVVTRENSIVGMVPVATLVPSDLMERSTATDDFFVRVGIYGDQLLNQ